MLLVPKLKILVKDFKRELQVYRNVIKDDRESVLPKFFIVVCYCYLLMPFDLIPDFIPVFGQLDDIIIIPVLLYSALKLIPYDDVEDHRRILQNG